MAVHKGMQIAGAILVLATFVLLGQRSQTQKQPMPVDDRPVPTGTRITSVLDREINECSGIILSSRNKNCFWMHNDSGDYPRMFLVHFDGRTVGQFAIRGAKAIDWEDIAIAEIGNESYLVLGDIGGNAQRRRTITLYVVREPIVETASSGAGAPVKQKCELVCALEVSIPLGVTNYESIAFDPVDRILLIVEKASSNSRVYSVVFPDLSSPLAGRTIPVTAKEVSSFDIHSATACDVSRDGSRMVIINSDYGYLFQRQANADGTLESWTSTLAHPHPSFRLPDLYQSEAVCFASDARSIYVASERAPTPVVELQLED